MKQSRARWSPRENVRTSGKKMLEAQVGGVKRVTGLMKFKRECFSSKSSSAGVGMRMLEQPRLSCGETQLTTVSGYRHVDGRGSEQGGNTSLQAIVGETHDKISNLAASCQIVIVRLGWLRREVKTGDQQHRQFDPGESMRRRTLVFWRATHITAHHLRL